MPESLLQIKSKNENLNIQTTNFLLKNDPIVGNVEPIFVKNQNHNVTEINIESNPSTEFCKFDYLSSEEITQKIVEQLYE